MRIDFHASARPTLGVEWELALVDRVSRDLVSVASEVHELAAGRLDEPARLHKELLRNTVELTTGICRTTGEAVDELAALIDLVRPLAAELNVDLRLAQTQVVGHRAHRRGDVGGTGPRGQQHLADAQDEVHREVDLARPLGLGLVVVLVHAAMLAPSSGALSEG